MRRAFTILLLLAPLLRAQKTPVTLTLNAVEPRVIIGQISGPPGTFTTAPGSVTFTIGAATGTLSVQAPSSISGLDNGSNYQLSSPTVFTISHTLTGFSFVKATLSDAQSSGALCQVTNTFKTDTCSVKAISEGDVIAKDGTNIGSGVVLPAIIDLQVGNSTVEYGIYFQWSTDAAGGCPATSPAIPAGTGPRDDPSPTCPTSSITLDTALPYNSDPLPTFLTYLPAFCGFGTYTYRGPNQAHIFLELVDQQENILARSGINPDTGKALGKTIDFPSGSKLAWGGGCTDAKQLIFIADKFIMPRIDYPVGTQYDKVVASFSLQASLYDSGTLQRLATSTPVVYNVAPGVSATSQLVLRTQDDPSSDSMVDPSVPIEPSPRVAALNGARPHLENGTLVGAVRDAAAKAAQYNRLLLRVSLDLASSTGMLDAEIIILDAQGKRLEGAAKVAPRPASKGHNQIDLNLLGILNPGAAQIVIVPRITVDSGAQVQFTPTLLTVDSISIVAITPDPKKCDLKTSPQDCPVANRVNSFKTGLAIRPATEGETYEWVFVTLVGPFRLARNGPNPLAPDPAPTPGMLNAYDHIISADVIENAKYALVVYQRALPHHSSDAVLYTDFTTLAAQIAGGVANQAYNFVDGKLNGMLSAANHKIGNLKRAGQGLAIADQIDRAAKFGLPPHVSDRFKTAASDRAAMANPPFLSIDSIWQFDPPIPHDGSFSASISLNYDAAVLPDDPNFDESKLQVVSSDSSGTLRAYPTTLDITNKVATAQIDGLDPYYSLAVVGPFTQTPVMLASTSTGYALVNTGTQDSNLSVTAFSTDGAGTPATPVLKAANQMKSSGSDWVQAWSNQSTVAGVSWFDNGSQFAMTPAQAPGQIFVFTDVEYDTRKWTEIDLANTSPFDAQVAIDLFGSDGSSQGTYSTTIAPKDTFAARLESMFPALAAGFSGYAMVRSRETLAASGLQWTNTIVAGLAAQSITDAKLAATTAWYAPQLGGSGLIASLHLVNTAATTANVTLKAWGTNGSPAAANVKIQLAPGQQFTSVIPDIFNIDSAIAGSLEVDSDAAGVFGDVLTVDSSFFPKYSISLPLSGQPVTSSVLPYAGPKTTVYVFNPNSSTANVTVTPYGADGAKGSASSATVPAFGRGTITVNANAYATVGSSQPVVASGWIDVPARTTTGYLAIPSSGAPTGPGSTSVPTIVVTPGSFDFGNVTVGQSRAQKFTIGNSGQADLHVQSVGLSGGAGFSLPAFTPTTIAAGKSVDVNVTFQPVSAASVSASLTIGSDDPNQSSLVVKLTGTGLAPPAPAINVAVPNLDFGTVNVNSTKDITLTVSNSGNAVLNVTAALSPNPPFRVVTPAASFTVGAGSIQTVTVRFAPTVTGAQLGTLTITSNDPANPSLTYKFTGTGAAASASTDVVLKIDGGVFDAEVGYPNGTATAYFLNRLTPPSYPATIKSVQIFFSTRADGLRLNTPLTILSGTNATIGAATLSLNSASTDFVPGTVSALDTFITYTVPSRTITSGDFVIGFMVQNAPGIYPAEQDQLTPSQARSYTSNNGVTFVLLDSISTDVAGNLGIRAVATVGGTSASTCITPPANVVSWWRGDGNTNDSSGGNNGTVQGAATFAAGEIGQAFNFDGNTGYVSIGNPANLRLTSAMTIEGWVNPRAVPSGTNLASIVTKWGQKFDPTPDSDSYGLWLRPNNGGLMLFSAIHQSGTTEPGLQGGSIPLNAWTHVAMTFDGATGQYILYVNGQPVASQTLPGQIFPTSRNVLIGREDSFLPRPFNGLIDEVTIYSRALTGSEIQAIFKAGGAGKCTGTSVP